MSLSRFHIAAITGWLAALASFFVLRVIFGGSAVSVTELVVWLMSATIPSAMILGVFRGAPPQTIAQVLYTAEQVDPARPVNGASPSNAVRP